MPENSQSEFEPEEQSKPFAAPASLGEYDGSDAIDESDPIERESLSFGGILSWLTIALVVTVMIATTAFFRSGEESRTEATSSDLFPVQLQARTIVGQKSFLGGMGDKPAEKDANGDEVEFDEEEDDEKTLSGPPVPEQLNDGTYEQRLCYVILVGESNGPDEAAEKLSELDDAARKAGFEFNDDQKKLREIVGTLIESQQEGDFDAAPLTEDDRDFIKEKLGWIGEIALVPEGTRNVATRDELLSDASWSMGLMMTFMVLLMLTLMAGVAMAAVFSVLFATAKLKPKFLTHGKSVNIYIETFALWMVFFFGGPELTVFAMGAAGIEMTTSLGMLVSIGFFFGSLIVLVYPVIRGIPFRQMCSDIGWKAKGGLVDVAEAYPLAARIVSACGRDIRSLAKDGSPLKTINPADFVDARFGLPTVRDILSELEKPGRDPRPAFKTATFADGVHKIEDLEVGMMLEGTISNVAAFGAFVDIGVHQDGLVHISQIADRFVKDPSEIVKAGDVVKSCDLDARGSCRPG